MILVGGTGSLYSCNSVESYRDKVLAFIIVNTVIQEAPGPRSTA